jgi:hypothetical protein
MSLYVIVCHGSLSLNFVSLPSRREGDGWWAEWHCSAGLALQYRNGELSIRQLERLLDVKKKKLAENDI